MFRKVMYLLFVVALIAGFAFSPAKAQAPTGPASYRSTFQIQNLSASAATISIVFYDATTGAALLTLPDTIAANDSKDYQNLTQLSAGFKGSVVISSNQPVASTSNLVGLDSAGKDISFASYSAFSAGSPTVSLPLLFKNNFTYYTFFSVQNTGSADANITVNYSDGTTNTANGVKPGASVTFDQSKENHTQAVFAATVSGGSVPLAVTVVEYNPTTLFAYGGFGSGSTTLVMPLINTNNFGFITGVQVQNQGSQETQVTVSYTPSLAGTACTETRRVAANSSVNFALNVFVGDDPTTLVSTTCVKGQQFVGSAVVTANSTSQPLVAIVNQLNSAARKGAAYNAFNPASGKQKIVFPLLMDRNFSYFTSWSIVNVGTAAIPAGQLSCAVKGKANGVDFTKTVTNPDPIAAGGGWTMNHNNQFADKFVGGATCTTTVANASLVGSVNQLGTAGTVDSLLVYEGFSVAP